MSGRIAVALPLALLLLAVPGGAATVDDATQEWSVPLGSFRYQEVAVPFVEWLGERGVPAWTAEQVGGDGRWFEVRAGQSPAPDELDGLVADLRGLGFRGVAPEVSPARPAGFDRTGLDRPAPGGASLGPLLHGLAVALPCHPRFELISFHAAAPGADSTDEIDAVVLPAVHDLVANLAADEAEPALAQAVVRDMVTGTSLYLSLVWRDPSGDLALVGSSTGRPEAVDWSAAPRAALPDLEPAGWVAWSAGARHVLVVGADGETAGPLVGELLSGGGCTAGALSSPALARPLTVLPEGWLPGDRPVAVRSAILGAEYVGDKRGAAWAARMQGRWASTTWQQAASGDLWSLSVFDLETADAAREVHRWLYSDRMASIWASDDNAAARRLGLNAVYRTSVHGEPAWYVDTWWGAQHKELNFVAGPFVFAIGSYVRDTAPLRMGDLIARAELLPALAPPYAPGQATALAAVR